MFDYLLPAVGRFFFLLFMSCSAVLFYGEKNKMTWQFSFLFFMLFCFDDGEKSQGIQLFLLCVCVCILLLLLLCVCVCMCVCWGRHFSVCLTDK